jgi:hypothetical protein
MRKEIFLHTLGCIDLSSLRVEPTRVGLSHLHVESPMANSHRIHRQRRANAFQELNGSQRLLGRRLLRRRIHASILLLSEVWGGRGRATRNE